jgi:predicted phage terminase large subunit-like protein
MAIINGKWHNRKERMAKLAILQKTIAKQYRAFKAGKLSPDEKVELQRYIAEYKRVDAINLGESDLLFFAYNWFGENLNPENSGNWIPAYDETGLDIDNKPQSVKKFAPGFHHEICDIMNVVSTEEINRRIVVAAPRSHAKSSFLSKAFPIHEIVYRLRRYIILISETPTVSSANLEWIKTQLQHNEKLRRDFGEILHPKQQMNPRDNSSEFIAWEDLGEGKQRQLTLVQAASSGQALRGRNWNGNRPDLIVCDDLEDKRNTNTEQLRQELKDWFRQVVIPLGDPEGKKTAIVFMGTTVHHQSLLIEVMNHRSDFEKRHYKAVIEWPERSDLWEDCRQIYTNREDPKAAQNAELFYIANRKEMDRGAKVLWPDVQPLYKLMTKKWDDGSKAFNTEYMNNPLDEESMIFNPNTFKYWDGGNYDFHSDKYVISFGVDFALGKERSDYQAYTVVARDKVTGVMYVVESYLDKVPLDQYLNIVVEKIKHWQPDIVAADSNAFQEVVAKDLKNRLIAEGYPASTRYKEIKNRTKKELRIEAMKPDIEGGMIMFSRKHALLLEQFEQYGQGSHDDGPDSMNMAITTVIKSSRRKAGNAGSYRY